MAEIILSAILTELFIKLSSAALEKLARYKGIDSDLKKWERLLLQIRDVVNDASQKEIADLSVKRWLNGLQHLAYDIDDILDELATEAMHRELTEESRAISNKVRKLIPSCCTSFPSSTRMHDKLSIITSKLQDIVEEKTTLGLIVLDGRSRNINKKFRTSLVDASSIVGRQGDKELLLHKLLGDRPYNRNFSIVPVVGMGGIGKTTLARLLYDEEQVKVHFELKAWVCVSDEFDCFNISKVIYQSVTGENREFADLNLLQVALRDQLIGKRFLLVLDDVWTESFDDWETLVGPFLLVAPGSQIIMTMRKKQLLKRLGYNHPLDLQSLSHDDAMFLFAQHALGVNNFDLHPTLRPYGEGIVKKCDGLPLALRAIGRLLREKTDEEEWEEVLNSEIWRVKEGYGIIPALRLSYLDLSAHLKQLFAYSSLFPKNYVFHKEDLILLWMAEGFLHQSTSNKLTERLGHECFEELVSRSFFQHVPNDESMFVMHDLINDLAKVVSGDFFVCLDKEIANEPLEKYRHMSFIREEYVVYRKFKALYRATSLRTFLTVSIGVEESWKRFYLSNKILSDLLPELPLLRVLCLSCFEISEVPESIGSLKHLRYLNLSRTQIVHIPENVCNLFNLQTLIVFGCRRLNKLPKSFVRLKNLRHFDIRDTPLLNKMPLGIGELKNLQTLSKIIIDEDNGFALTELKKLKNLQGKISLKGLDQVQNAMNAHEASLSQKRLSELEVEWSDKFDNSRMETHEKEVLYMLKPYNDYLRKLEIVSYGGIEFPSWLGDPLFVRLTHVSIRGCKKCSRLPPLGQLPSLKELFLQGMDEVNSVGLELLGTSVAFSSLEILSFKDMTGWKVWSTVGGVVDTVFPCLRVLHIECCPNLVKVSVEALQSLRVLKITSCGHGVLRSLVQAASSVTKLEIWSIFGLTDEVWGSITESLGAVEEVNMDSCDEIRYLWESAESSKVLVNLRKLVVCSCESLMSLGDKDEDDNGTYLTSLRILDITGCNNLESCICPNSIEMLRIIHCTSITFVSFRIGGGKKLKSIVINGCQVNELGGENSRVLINRSIQLLEGVYIRGWPNLNSVPEMIHFIHLTRLVIRDCASMESFPDHELPNLSLLKYMAILDCPSMDDSFPRGLWPPKLNFLRIGRLKKPISQRGPQNFPSSLLRLELWGGPSDHMSSCSQLSHLFPPSLTYLFIKEFEKLETFSTGLQHLISLQIFFVYKCPKMIDLPEMLLPSLLSLTIYGCPNMKQRLTRKGCYWPLISHIPCIDTD